MNDAAKHLIWAALEKVAKKELLADHLQQGTSHEVQLNISGNVDGEFFAQSISSLLSIGFAQTKSSSVNPQPPELLAWVLSKLNEATRNRIINDLPVEFESKGKIPETDKALVVEAKELLKKLRRSKTVQARGAIRCEYVINEPS